MAIDHWATAHELDPQQREILFQVIYDLDREFIAYHEEQSRKAQQKASLESKRKAKKGKFGR